MTDALRLLISQRAANCCEYCRMQGDFSHDPFSAEHILPISKGGQNDLENLAWSCLGCNLYKFTAISAIDMVTGDIVPLYNPRKDTWNEHFKWSEDFSLIIGLTSQGRATVTRLKLIRQGLINLRQVLTKVDKHPPK
jgi:HNH endonuclease